MHLLFTLLRIKLSDNSLGIKCSKFFNNLSSLIYFAFNKGIPSLVILGAIYFEYSNPANFVIKDISPSLYQCQDSGISKGMSLSIHSGSLSPIFS